MIFIALDYSPWSDKARWALDHSGADYVNKTYVSMVGEPWLRFKTNQYKGAVSVPVLLDAGKVFSDSFDIAIYADSKRIHQQRQTLFPNTAIARKWNELSEKALTIGRYHCVVKQLDNTQAQQEILPSFIPDAAKPYFTWLARDGLKYHLKKYPVKEELAAYRAILLKLREALGNKGYILDAFSYCDIVMALALQYVNPVEHKYSAPGPAVADCWTHRELLEEFSDLIEWRDWIYLQHR